MSDLREQLRGRQRPTLEYELPVGDVMEARRRLAEEREALREAKARCLAADAAQAASVEDPEAAARAAVELQVALDNHADARAAVARADAAVDDCYLRITITAMKPGDYEALLAEHPPREDHGDKEYNQETFPRACFLACATQLRPEEWAEFLDENLSWAECQDLFTLAVAANTRLINRAIPKG